MLFWTRVKLVVAICAAIIGGLGEGLVDALTLLPARSRRICAASVSFVATVFGGKADTESRTQGP